MKRVTAILLSAVLLIGCGSSVASAEPVKTEYGMFEEHKASGDYTVLVDKETKVCYLVYGYVANPYTGASYGGITVMLNADGTPKLWEE